MEPILLSKILTHLEWKTASQRCPGLGNFCSYLVRKFHGAAYTIYAIPPI